MISSRRCVIGIEDQRAYPGGNTVRYITVARRDSFRLLQSVLMNVKGLNVLSKFCGNVTFLMYVEDGIARPTGRHVILDRLLSVVTLQALRVQVGLLPLKKLASIVQHQHRSPTCHVRPHMFGSARPTGASTSQRTGRFTRQTLPYWIFSTVSIHKD